jgi:deoxyribonuclease-4
MTAFRGELERAVALGAEYLVMHPGSSTGGDHGEAKRRFIDSVLRCAEGLEWGTLTLLIENTAGGGSHLGGTFEEVAELVNGLASLPVGACIDTCHTWVAGYDLVTPEGYEATLQQLDATVGLDRVHVFHVNDAKAAMGSRLDRHEHIGKGQLGEEVFARLLRDPRCSGKAFIAETPVDDEGDERSNLQRLFALAGEEE